jgi:hypothetical protein
MFPSYEDFGAAGLISFMVYGKNRELPVEFRVVQPGKESTIVSYGFRGSAVEDIKRIALEYRKAATLKTDVAQIGLRQNLLGYHLAKDSFIDYLQYACAGDLGRKRAKVCKRHPQYFIWPSERFFMHYRPQ